MIRFLWFVGESVVGAIKASLPKPEEHPLDWHGQPPPVCKSCGYDLRGSPDRCSECGAELDPVDSAIVRYMISVGHTPVVQPAAKAPPPEPGKPCVVFGRRRGELKYRPTRA